MGRRLLGIGSAMALIGLLYWGFASWRYGADLALAVREMETGQHGPARDRLAKLSARWPGQPVVEFSLGVCEQALGHTDLALEAWGGFPRILLSPRRVAVPRAQALIVERGQFSAAEEILKRAIESRDASAIEASQTLARLYFWQGRLREMRRLLQAGWPDAPDRAAALRDYWKLDTDPIPTVAIQAALTEPRRRLRTTTEPGSPVQTWRRGRVDSTRRRSGSMSAKRHGPTTRRSGRAGSTGRSPRVMTQQPGALSHLTIDTVAATEILALEAWLASRRGLPEREPALESLVALEPGHSQALERLAALAREAGRTDCAVKCLQDKMAV